jgi:hypothetical protein
VADREVREPQWSGVSEHGAPREPQEPDRWTGVVSPVINHKYTRIVSPQCPNDRKLLCDRRRTEQRTGETFLRMKAEVRMIEPDRVKLPRFRGVVLDLGDYGSIVTASIAAS